MVTYLGKYIFVYIPLQKYGLTPSKGWVSISRPDVPILVLFSTFYEENIMAYLPLIFGNF